MNLQFTKMHGLGNDFVVINAMEQPLELTPDQIRFLSDRHTGIGCDQLLLLQTSVNPDVDVHYRIFNADGTEVEQCGNGARCIGRYLHDKGLVSKQVINAETVKGIIRIYLEEGNTVRVNMGAPEFEPGAIPILISKRLPSYTIDTGNGEDIEIYALSMGNPHAVIFVSDVDRAEVEKLGQTMQTHRLFPESVNVGFMQIVDRGRIKLRVYERGAGETLACGTGACAAVVAGIIAGRLDNEVVVGLNRGNLLIRWEGEGTEVWMAGPATSVYEGQISL